MRLRLRYPCCGVVRMEPLFIMFFSPLGGCLSQFELVHQQAEKALDSGHQEAHEVTPGLLRGELICTTYCSTFHGMLYYLCPFLRGTVRKTFCRASPHFPHMASLLSNKKPSRRTLTTVSVLSASPNPFVNAVGIVSDFSGPRRNASPDPFRPPLDSLPYSTGLEQ